MEIGAIARKWGSSLAVILPKSLVDAKKIKENDEIMIRVEKKRPLVRDLFGKFPRKSNKTGQEIKDELRDGWSSYSDREREKRWKNQK